MSDLSGVQDVGKKGGAHALLTNYAIDRSACYHQGIILALSRFVADEVYWK
jgi:non-canonical (house-cleaning) NTP pyrophosphatase